MNTNTQHIMYTIIALAIIFVPAIVLTFKSYFESSLTFFEEGDYVLFVPLDHDAGTIVGWVQNETRFNSSKQHILNLSVRNLDLDYEEDIETFIFEESDLCWYRLNDLTKIAPFEARSGWDSN